LSGLLLPTLGELPSDVHIKLMTCLKKAILRSRMQEWKKKKQMTLLKDKP